MPGRLSTSRRGGRRAPRRGFRDLFAGSGTSFRHFRQTAALRAASKRGVGDLRGAVAQRAAAARSVPDAMVAGAADAAFSARAALTPRRRPGSPSACCWSRACPPTPR